MTPKHFLPNGAAVTSPDMVATCYACTPRHPSAVAMFAWTLDHAGWTVTSSAVLPDAVRDQLPAVVKAGPHVYARNLIPLYWHRIPTSGTITHDITRHDFRVNPATRMWEACDPVGAQYLTDQPDPADIIAAEMALQFNRDTFAGNPDVTHVWHFILTPRDPATHERVDMLAGMAGNIAVRIAFNPDAPEHMLDDLPFVLIDGDSRTVHETMFDYYPDEEDDFDPFAAPITHDVTRVQYDRPE